MRPHFSLPLFLISVPAAQAEEAAYKLVLLRHGESQWNLEKRFTGWSDVDLTDKGRAGAVKAGEIMKGAGVNFDEVNSRTRANGVLSGANA